MQRKHTNKIAVQVLSNWLNQNEGGEPVSDQSFVTSVVTSVTSD